MIRKAISASLAAAILSVVVYGQTQPASTKGYELYSWLVDGHWNYSLLPGTNRLKSYGEITAPAVVRRDTAGLKAELRKLQKGEEVVWMSDAPAGAGRSPDGRVLNVKHPSRSRIKNIKAFCDKLGIKLSLS